MITTRTLGTVLTAGAFATLAFDIFGQGLSPLFGYARLAPTGLADGTIKAIFGGSLKGASHLLHFATGMIFYAIGYFAIARPVQRAILPNLHWGVTAVVYGVALWAFALYVMAHLVVGMKPFLGFTGITWVALWGHIVYAVVAAWIMEAKGAVLDLPQLKKPMVPAE